MPPDSDDGFVSKISHPLCNSCKAIFATIPFNIPGQYEGEHHLTVRDLEESAGNRCQLCIIALNRVTQETLEAWRCSDLDSSMPIRWSITFSREWPDFFSIRWKKSVFLNVYLPFEEIEEGTQVAPPAIRTSYSTGSEETFTCARGWLTDCTTTHEQCRTLTSKGWLPTRLIYVGSTADAPSARLCLRADVPAESMYMRYAGIHLCSATMPATHEL